MLQKRRQRPPTRVRLYRISPHCPDAPLYLVPKAVSARPGCSHPDWTQLDARGCFLVQLLNKVGADAGVSSKQGRGGGDCQCRCMRKWACCIHCVCSDSVLWSDVQVGWGMSSITSKWQAPGSNCTAEARAPTVQLLTNPLLLLRVQPSQQLNLLSLVTSLTQQWGSFEIAGPCVQYSLSNRR
jgi:hypothetical protein